jgi:outer membrane protein
MLPRLLVLLALPLVCSAADDTAAAPLPLREAVRLALAKNYSIRVESFNPQIRRAELTTEYGRFDPSLRLSYSYSESGNPQAADPFTGTRPPGSISATDEYTVGIEGLTPWGLTYSVGGNTQNYRGTFNKFAHQYYSFGGLQVRQPLLRDFGFGSGLASLRIAKTNRAISDAELRQTLIDTVTEVITTYNTLYLAREYLRAAVESRNTTATLLSENERRYQVGNVSESDVTAAKAQVALREESILQAQRYVEFETSRLRQLISDDVTAATALAPITIEAPGEVPHVKVNAAEDFRKALADRPDFERARLLVKRGEYNRAYAANQRLPRVDFVGSYGYYGLGSTWPDSRRALEERDTRSYSAGAVVTVPLTFAQERGRYRAAKLQLRQAEMQREQLEQQILVAISNAAADIENTQKRVAASRNYRELAERSLADETKLHRSGKSYTLRVIQAQEYLLAAQRGEAQAVADALNALAEYDRQLGTTLDKNGIVLTETQPAAAPRS